MGRSVAVGVSAQKTGLQRPKKASSCTENTELLLKCLVLRFDEFP